MIPPDKRARLKAAGFTDAEIDADFGPAITPKIGAESTTTRGPATAPKARRPLEYGVGLLRQAAQGASFNTADEIEGGLRSLWPGSGPYKQERDKVRAENDAFASDNPLMSGAANLAGGLGTGMGALKVASKVPMLAWLLPSGTAGVGTKMFAGMTGGAVAGGAAGVGAANEMTDAGDGFVKGAVIGGALGGTLPAAGSLLKGTVNKVASGIRGGRTTGTRANIINAAQRVGVVEDPQIGAVRRILSANEKGGATLDDVAQRVTVDMGLPRTAPNALFETIDDVATGAGLKKQGTEKMSVARNAGRERIAVDQSLRNRSAADTKLLQESVSEATGMASPRDPKAFAQEALDAVQPRVEKLSRRAAKEPDVRSKTLVSVVENLSSTRAGRAALERARELSNGFDALQAINPADPVVSVRNIQFLRQGIDRALQEATQEADGQMVAILQKQRARVDRVLKKAGGRWQRESDRLWEGANARGESFSSGQKVPDLTTTDAADRLLGEARDPEAFRQGAGSKLLERTKAVNNEVRGRLENPAGRLFGDDLRDDLTDYAVTDPAARNALYETAKNVTRRFDSMREISGNSATMPRQMAHAAEFGGPGSEIVKAAVSPRQGLFSWLGRKADDLTSSTNADQATEMARLLGAGLPDQMTKDAALTIMRNAGPTLQKQQRRSLLTSLTAGSASGGRGP